MGALFVAQPWEESREDADFTCSSSLLPSTLSYERTVLSRARYAASSVAFKAVCHGKVLAIIPAAPEPAGAPAGAPDEIQAADSHTAFLHSILGARAPPAV